MEWHQNPRLEQELRQRLSAKYMTEKPIPHVTELIYCLTRGMWDRIDPLEPTADELILFAVGFGLEEVLLRKEEQLPIVSRRLDGIWYTPDYISLRDGGVDLKSTRMSPTDDGSPKQGWPETWLRQIKAYAYAVEMEKQHSMPEWVEFSLAVLYVIQAKLFCGTFIFTREELVENWRHLQQRHQTYINAHIMGQVPRPFVYNEPWECQRCRYKARCEMVSQQGYYDGKAGRRELK